MVLVDTCIWISYLNGRRSEIYEQMDALILARQVATCKPIVAEIFSGPIKGDAYQPLLASFLAMMQVDLDWNEASVWLEVAALAESSFKQKRRIPSLIDRMIILAAHYHQVTLWTSDQHMLWLAEKKGIATLATP